MEKLICKECGKTFEYEKLSSCKAQLKRHLHEEHHMSIIDYVVKYEYNGKRPLCPCGCGHELNLSKNGDRWAFTKYYEDTCYGRLVRSCNDEVLKHYKDTHKREFDIVRYYESHYDRKTYEEAFNVLREKHTSLTDVAKLYNIDKRTLKKVWLGLNIVQPEELTELLDYTKYQLSSINYPTNTLENDSLISWCFNLIKACPGKYTPHSLQEAYNKAHPTDKTNHSGELICKALYKAFGDEIEMYLSNGYHSSEEYQFYNILKFYLPDYICKLGKKFITNNGYIFYDILIGSRLLIEYDSDGYFHSSKESQDKDLDKEKFAKENGYQFLRLTKKDIKKIDTIINIKNILNNEIN